MTFNVDGTYGVRRTQVFAGSATDTLLFVDHRNEQNFLSWYFLIVCIPPTPAILVYSCLQRNHLYGSGWAFASTKSARFLVLYRDAKFASPNGVTNLNGSSFFYRNRLNGRSGADLRATITFWTTISSLETYLWLHEAIEAAAWSKHIIRTGIYAELAGSTMRSKVPDRERTWRRDKFFALWFLLFDKVCESAICSLGLDLTLSLCQSCACEKRNSSHNSSSAFVNLYGRAFWSEACEVQSVVSTLQFTVPTNYATRVIDCVCVEIYAG